MVNGMDGQRETPQCFFRIRGNIRALWSSNTARRSMHAWCGNWQLSFLEITGGAKRSLCCPMLKWSHWHSPPMSWQGGRTMVSPFLDSQLNLLYCLSLWTCHTYMAGGVIIGIRDQIQLFYWQWWTLGCRLASTGQGEPIPDPRIPVHQDIKKTVHMVFKSPSVPGHLKTTGAGNSKGKPGKAVRCGGCKVSVMGGGPQILLQGTLQHIPLGSLFLASGLWLS